MLMIYSAVFSIAIVRLFIKLYCSNDALLFLHVLSLNLFAQELCIMILMVVEWHMMKISCIFMNIVLYMYLHL